MAELLLVVGVEGLRHETKVTPCASNTSTSLAKSVTRSPILAASAGTTARWRSNQAGLQVGFRLEG